ncbi:MAG: hypothetical protein KA436_05035 [Oligoflexales bacterium]|nr:hypothetical protein [Oligoflexales bacterium]
MLVQCNIQTLQDYFDRYGWVYRHDGQGIFYSGWSTKQKNYGLKITVSDTLFFFEVRLLALSSWKVRNIELTSFWEYLLELNNNLSVVRLGLNEKDTVTLSSESFAEGFSYEQLVLMLGVIAHFSETIQKKLIWKLSE